MRSPVNHALPFAALLLLGGGALASDRSTGQAAPTTGPAADYPVVVGEPFTIGTTVWTPSDQLNYDAVGYATTGEAGLAGVTGAHKTLPLPSYVEVTALDSGKTVLVRLERRGPMVNDALVELSPAATAQLGLAPGAHSPVRVRRVNPPEQERAMLRTGGHVPERMETPEGLLKVLRRKLHDQSPLSPPPSVPPTMPAGPPAVVAEPIDKPSRGALPAKATPPAKAVAQPSKPAVPPARPSAPAQRQGSLVIQVGSFSAEAGARKAAGQLGGTVSRAGKYWRVQLGPFTNRAQAAPALEKARHAGYSDARIQSAD